MAPVLVEQLYYTWDRRNVDGSGGRGIFGHSSHWPPLREEELVELKRRVQLYGEHAPTPGSWFGPHSLARYRIGGRYVLVRKSDAGKDAFGRPGNFVAHVLTGFPADGDHQALLAAWHLPVPARELDPAVAPSRALPPVEVDLAAGQGPGGPATLGRGTVVDAVAALLAPQPGPVVLLGDDTDAVAVAVCQIVAAFPPGCADDLTFSTHELEPVRSGVAVAGMVGVGPAFEALVAVAAERAAFVFDLRRQEVIVDRATDLGRELAVLLLSGRAEPAAPAGSRDLVSLPARLEPWLLLGRDPASLTGPQVVLLLGSPVAETWWARALPQELRLGLVTAALHHDPVATVEALMSLGAAAADSTGPAAALRAHLLGVLAVDAAGDSRALRALRPTATERAQMEVRSWLRATRTGSSPPAASAVAAAVLRSWGTLPPDEVEAVLADGEVGRAVAGLVECRGEVARKVVMFALEPERHPLPALVAGMAASRPADLCEVLRSRLQMGDSPGHLAERLARRGSTADDAHVLLLVDAMFGHRSRDLGPILAVLLDRFSGDRSAMAELLGERRVEVHEVFGLPTVVTRYIWPEAGAERHGWFRSRRGSRSRAEHA